MSERAGHFQAVLDHYRNTRRLPTVAAAVLDDDGICWSGTAGGTTTLDTQYRIGSITKTLTAVLVLQCRDEGLCDLDDPLARFVPESGYAQATLRELLSHTSGMQSEPAGPWWERSPGIGIDRLLARNNGSGRVAGPGEEYHYSNLGFALLGEVVARLRGTTWRQAVEDRVLAPLGMARTSYLPQQPAASGLSVHHLANTLTDEPAQDTGAMAPAGQLWSTVGDLARFLRFLRSGGAGVLAAASCAEMATGSTVDPGYGLGTMAMAHPGGRLIGHLGSMPGFQATALVDPGSGDGVVALTNATTGFAGLELTVRMLGDRTPGSARQWRPTQEVPQWAADLLGWWFWGNSCFEVRWQSDALEFHDLARGVLAERFTHRDGEVVGIEGYHRGETLHVVRHQDGTVGHLECATFVYTHTPYDPSAPIPGGHPGR